MTTEKQYDVVIIGGGLAGLTSAILLASAKVSVLLIEKECYPFHKVCGEYISNEVRPFLERNGLDLDALGVYKMNQLRISDSKGRNAYADLPMGGFGISRYTLDQALYKLALEKGAVVMLNSIVKDVQFENGIFEVQLRDANVVNAKFVIGAYGKRTLLDKQFKREFVSRRTGYMAVKYHIKIHYPAQEIGLDNFPGGYCGISKIEGDLYCLCYLVQRQKMEGFKTIAEMEKAVLYTNPVLQDLFQRAEFVFPKPEVINEIYFADKELVVNHVLMCGDAAGLITPLCGNGMSMAINGAKILSEIILKSGLLSKQAEIPISERLKLEDEYRKVWKQVFKSRLMTGRIVQRFFLIPFLADIALFVFKRNVRLQQWIIKKTHGKYI